jgi:ATP-dependent DNA helicase HFM1/MER3
MIRAITQLSSPEKEFKCVFVAPNKALCQQRALMWEKSFSSLGLKVIEVTGDTETNQSLSLIAKANIIITTPEKWDSLTRAWRSHIFLFGSLALLLIDEIHHIHEDRGAVLETIVVRMRSVGDAYRHRALDKSDHILRVVALSATLPNIEDVGAWLKCPPKNIHYFDETFRPGNFFSSSLILFCLFVFTEILSSM